MKTCKFNGTTKLNIMRITLPLLLLVLLFGIALPSFSQRFIPLLAEDASILDPQHGPDGAINTVIEYNNQLLFAGRFSNVNQDESMALAATWNGASYAPITPSLPEISGLSGIIDALDCPLGLVLSGRMSDVNNILLLSDNAWITPGEGFDNTVFDVIWFNDELYAAGRFTMSGSNATAGVARWNGSAWEAIDNGMDDRVYDLEVFNDQLYAVGAFTMAGSAECNRIARLNGNTWEAVGTGFNDDAYCMSIVNNELYIGGSFDADATESESYYGLCAYDGATYSALHSGPETFDVASIIELNNTIIVSERGSQFTSFMTKSDSKQLIDNNLENLNASWPEVHHAAAWNNAIYTCRNSAEMVEPNNSFYLNNALFKFTPSGSLNGVLSTEEVSTLVLPSATMFNDPISSSAAYFVGDNDPEVATIYAAAPWISALVDGQETLYTNYQTFGGDESSQEYYFGPFSDEYNSEYIEKYLQVWSLSAEEVSTHINEFDADGYIAPSAILTWPGNGRLESNESLHLAPFEDTNSNGLYEPELGDYPVIRGDRCAFYILSTNREGINTNDIGMEIMVMLYAYDETPETIFLNYQLNNFSGNDYEQVKLGIWTDGDLGNSTDDYFGSSPENDFYYFYNGDNFDEPSFSSPGFGENPPMQAITFLNGEMSNCISYQNSANPINGEPQTPEHYNNYLNSIWKDGSSLLFGGDGFNPGTGADPENPTAYMYPSDPNLPAGEDVWSETSEGTPPADRRALGSFGSLSLAPEETVVFDIAFVSAMPDGPLDAPAENFDNLVSSNEATMDFFNLLEFELPEVFPVGLDEIENTDSAFHLYPNPCSNSFSFLSSKTNIQSLVIRDLNGKVVHEVDGVNNREMINISHLNQGMYFVYLINTQGQVDTQKLIKN
jgi:hypothetical protein